MILSLGTHTRSADPVILSLPIAPCSVRPDALKQAGARGQWFLPGGVLGWPADSDAFFNKYNGAVHAHGRLPSGFARELQEWRTRGAKAGTVYATCAPSHVRMCSPWANHSPYSSHHRRRLCDCTQVGRGRGRVRGVRPIQGGVSVRLPREAVTEALAHELRVLTSGILGSLT